MKKRIAALFLVLGASFALGFAAESPAGGTTKRDDVTFSPALLTNNHTFEQNFYYASSDGLAEFFADIFSLIWAGNNLFVTFDTYPYATSPHYLKTQSIFSALSGTDVFAEEKSSRFAVDVSAFSYIGEAYGARARFEGFLWKCIGPVFELNTYRVQEAQTTEDAFFASRWVTNTQLLNLRLGGELSLLQTNPLSIMLEVQWTHFFGTYLPAQDGIVLGIILRSYPTKPLLLEWRGNIQTLSYRRGYTEVQGEARKEGLYACESHLELGFMLNGPVELFAAWNYTLSEVLRIEGHGIEVGLRYHF